MGKARICLLIFVPKCRQSGFFYCSVMVGHDAQLKAISGPRDKKGSEPLVLNLSLADRL